MLTTWHFFIVEWVTVTPDVGIKPYYRCQDSLCIVNKGVNSLALSTREVNSLVVRPQQTDFRSSYKNSSKQREKLSLVFGHC